MSEFVQIKQVENLADQLAVIPDIKQLAESANATVNEVKTALQNMTFSGARIKEMFTGLGAPPNTKIELVLNNNISSGQDVQVFFNGVMVEKIDAPIGSNKMYFMVPYITEPTDTIIVYYII